MEEASRFYAGAKSALPGLSEILFNDATMVLLLPQNISLRARRGSLGKELVRAHVLRGVTDDDRIGGSGSLSSGGSGGSFSRRHSSTAPGMAFDPFLDVRHMITLCGKAVQIHERRDPMTGRLTRHLHVFATQSRRAQYGGGPFRESRSVLVIDEEVVYDDNNRSFTALILERPLMGRGDVPRISGGEPLFFDDRPAIEWVRLLRDIAKSDAVTRGVLERAAKLAKKVPAVIAEADGLSAHIAEAAEDLHDASWKLAEKLVSGKVFGLAKDSTRLVEMLAEALDMYIMHVSYTDTFNKYFMAMAVPEPVLMQVLFQLRETRWKPREIPQELTAVPLTRTIECIQGLNDARSPLAKLQCISRASRCIMADVNMYFQKLRDGDISHAEADTGSQAGDIEWSEKEHVGGGDKDGVGDQLGQTISKAGGDGAPGKVENQVTSGVRRKPKSPKRRPTPIPESLKVMASQVQSLPPRSMPPINEDFTKTVVIAADEMLPLFISAVCDAAPAALLANTLYMRELSSQVLRDGKLGYALAMWEAAVSFIGRNVWSELALGDRDFGVASSDDAMRAGRLSVSSAGGRESFSSTTGRSGEGGRNDLMRAVDAAIDSDRKKDSELGGEDPIEKPSKKGVNGPEVEVWPEKAGSRASSRAHAINGSKEERDHWRFVHAIARAKLNAGKITEEEYTRIVTQYANVPSPYDAPLNSPASSDADPSCSSSSPSRKPSVFEAAIAAGVAASESADVPAPSLSSLAPATPLPAEEEALVDPLGGLSFVRRPSLHGGRQRSATVPARLDTLSPQRTHEIDDET